MQQPVFVGPRVRWIVEVPRASPIAGDFAHDPIISAETERLRGGARQHGAFRDRRRCHGAAHFRQRRKCQRRVVSGVHKHRRVSRSGVGCVLPGRICFNRRSGMIHGRLHPPDAAPCKQYDLLSGMMAFDAPGDRVQLVGTAVSGRRKMRELDGWLDRHLRLPASANDKTKQRDNGPAPRHHQSARIPK
jgi:hypothetical protein